MALLSLVVVAAVVGVGYAATRGGGHPHSAGSATSVAAAVTTAAASITPSPSALPAGVVAFLALPVGTPPTPGASEDGYPWHRLVATLTGPTSVQGGSTPDYRVRLTNRTSTAISLDPCPAYDLRVGLRDSSYGLNCGGTTSIAAGDSVTFDLPVPVPVPSSLSGSTTEISWSLGCADATSPPRRSAST